MYVFVNIDTRKAIILHTMWLGTRWLWFLDEIGENAKISEFSCEKTLQSNSRAKIPPNPDLGYVWYKALLFLMFLKFWVCYDNSNISNALLVCNGI